MIFSISSLVLSAAFASRNVLSAPLNPRQSACFITGNTPLPAEVAAGVPALAAAVTCDASKQITAGVPDVSSGGVSFSNINFADSAQNPLAFALSTFTSTDPKLLQNQLNTYLAVEAGVRSTGAAGNAFLGKVKVPKFFLQMQIAIVAKDAGEVVHQGEKVLKNAAGQATAAELAQVQALIDSN